MRYFLGVPFALLAAVGCTIGPPAGDAGAAKHDAEPPVCCRTDPDAGPEGCLCEPAAADIVMVTGATCSVSTTLNGQVLDYTGIVVSSCP